MSTHRTDEATATSRRRYVRALAALSATALAGCGGSGGDGGDGDSTPGATTASADGEPTTNGDATATDRETTRSGPAEFADLAVDGPTEATAGETATLTVSATNVGGAVGTLEAELTAPELDLEIAETVTLADVQPGETATADVELSVDLAGEYPLVLSAGERRVEYTLSVGPAEGAVDETVALGESLRVTLRGVDYASGFFVETIQRNYSPNVDTVLTPGEDLFALVRLDVENVGSQEVELGAPSAGYGGDESQFELGAGQLGLDPGSFVDEFRVSGYTKGPDAILDTGGDPVYGRTVAAGETASGWVLADVAETGPERDAWIGWHRDDPEGRPEVRWSLGADEFPTFALSGWSLPEEAQQGVLEHSFTVANEGETAGTFRAAVERSGGGWNPVDRVAATIPPGESRTFEREVAWPYSDSREFRIRPLSASREVTFTPRRAAIGESAVTPWGSATVEQVVTADRIDGTATNGEEGPWTPRNDTFVLVQTTHDRSGGPVQSDDPNDARRVLRVEVGEESYDFHSTSDNSGAHVAELSEPVVGSWGPEFVDVGETETGWIVFDVAGDVTVGDVVVRGRYQDGCRIEWTEK